MTKTRPINWASAHSAVIDVSPSPLVTLLRMIKTMTKMNNQWIRSIKRVIFRIVLFYLCVCVGMSVSMFQCLIIVFSSVLVGTF